MSRLFATSVFALAIGMGLAGAPPASAAPFTVNPSRIDPYKNFKFRVKWDGRYVAGVSKISPLRRSTEVIELREGGQPSMVRKTPGRTKYDAVTLERGLTHDTAFEDWADKTWRVGAGLGGEAALADFRKNVELELYNEAGQLVIRYQLFRCWPSDYVALPELDANSGAIALQKLTLECEGWDRDHSVVEPVEPH